MIRGASEVEFRLNKADQSGLNPLGINIIRQFNGNVTVWVARTLGGDRNTEFKYINVRRLFLMLRGQPCRCLTGEQVEDLRRRFPPP